MNREEARKKAEALVAKMTVEEKAGQLKFDAPSIERLGIPAYNWWNEALHGVARAGTATVFPQAIALAAMFDDKKLKEIADVIAEEGRAKYHAFSREGDRDIYKGLTFWSPNVNIFRDPRWGRGHENIDIGRGSLSDFKTWGRICKRTSGRWGYNEGSSLCKAFCSTFRTRSTPTRI